jgi:hypothetical protein
MIEKVHALLQEFEEKQAAGKIETFIVQVSPGGLLIQPQPVAADNPKSINLTPELLYTLQIFFSDIEGISFNSYDYVTLKSLLNAHGTLERMANKKIDIKK